MLACREGACLQTTPPIAHLDANVKEGAYGEVVSWGLRPKRRRLQAKLKDT